MLSFLFNMASPMLSLLTVFYRFVATIAIGRVLGLFALTYRHGFAFGKLEFQRGERGGFMRTVAETAVFAMTASAPIMRAGFQFANIGMVCRNFGVVHRLILVLVFGL